MINETTIEVYSVNSAKSVSKTIDSLADLHSVLNSIDWNEDHHVDIYRDDTDWLSVEGSNSAKSLDCSYCEHNIVYEIKESLTSIQQLIKILESFFLNDGKFKVMYNFINETEIRNEKEKRLAAYKKKIVEEEKKDRKTNFQKNLLVAFFLITVGFFGYQWYNDELQFFGQRTDTTTAEVVKTEYLKFGRETYLQDVRYEFVYNETTYKGSFTADKGTGKFYVGDKLKVKFATNNPNRSKMDAVYSRASNYK